MFRWCVALSRRRRGEESAAAPLPVARVEAVRGGHQVVIEAAAPLETVSAAAWDLWQKIGGPPVVSSEPIGFSAPAVISEPVVQQLMPPEIATPSHLDPCGDGLPDEHATRPGRLS